MARPSGWFPRPRRPGAPKKPFLTPLPRHTPTSALPLNQRRKRLIYRTFWALVFRWRYLATGIVTMGMVVMLLAGSLVVLRDSGQDPNKLPKQNGPSLTELNASIALGQQYVNALYKPLPNGEGVQSEASGVPLRTYFSDTKSWVLLGEDKRTCANGDCQNTTHISDVSDDATHDRYTAAFSSTTNRDALRVKVEIDWAYNARQFRLRLTPLQVKEPTNLYLDTTPLATFQPGDKAPAVRTFDRANQSVLRMLRFTVRHATQEGFLYWSTYGSNPNRSRTLWQFLRTNNFTPGFDVRAPLFAVNKQSMATLPDDLPVNDQSYQDCVHTPPETPLAYAYRSKVCLYEGAYIVNGERDPFLQAWDALTILQKYGSPTHSLPEPSAWTQGGTPKEVSEHLRGQWNGNGAGMGIPKCTPFSCGELSGIRTSVFGALETQLGYRYGDQSAQRFADAAARVIISTQVGADGKIRADNGTTYVRPGQAGSYYSAWTPELKFTQPSTPALPVAIALFIKGATPTPLEYQGVIPSNSETTLDALGFLASYRCAKYRVGCLG